ncbi:MAG: hypothetical protein AAF805_00205 [Planctomycetota bacterium]
MADPFRHVAAGEDLGPDHPLFSAQRHNAVTGMVQRDSRGGVPSTPAVSGGGAAAAAAAPVGSDRVVFVFDDLAGGSADEAGVVRIASVRCLPAVRASGGWQADTAAEFFAAEPISEAAQALDASGCEGAAALAGAGLTLAATQGAGNRITDADSGAFSAAGVGVDPASTIAATLSDGSASVTLGAATIDSAGSFTTAPVGVSSLAKGVLALEVTATLGSGAQQTTQTRRHAVTFAKGDGASDLARWPEPAPTPSLVGDPLRTDNGAPDVAVRGYRLADPEGPRGDVYLDGARVRTGTLVDFDAALELVWAVTPALAIGPHRLQVVLVDVLAGGVEYASGASAGLDFAVVGAGQADTAEPVKRLGVVRSIGGVDVLWQLSRCPQPLTTAEATKLAAAGGGGP